MTGYVPQLPDGPVDNPGNWRRASLEQSEGWLYQFNDASVAELERALCVARERSVEAPHFGKDDFPLLELAADCEQILDELENGHGFVVLRGFPAHRYSTAEAEIIFWGLGLYLGKAVPQNADGHLLGHVRDLGYDLETPGVRNYQTTEELIFHNDSCDVLGLMCLRQAKSGGRSSIASAIAVHNEMMQRCPALWRELYDPMAIDRRGERGWPGEGDEPYYALPVFAWHAGFVTVRYTVRSYYHTAQRFAGAPPLTENKVAALAALDAIAREKDFHIDFALEPGDMQFVNNYCVFHARTSFEDHTEPDRKRHMLRLWLATPNSRPLPPIYAGRFRSTEPGALRGGIAPAKRGDAEALAV